MTAEEKGYLKHWLINANIDEDNFKNNIDEIFSASKGEVLQMTSNISKGLEKLKAEGKAEILIKLLNKKFNSLPQEYVDKIKFLSENAIETIVTDIFDIEKVEDLKKYFKSKK